MKRNLPAVASTASRSRSSTVCAGRRGDRPAFALIPPKLEFAQTRLAFSGCETASEVDRRAGKLSRARRGASRAVPAKVRKTFSLPLAHRQKCANSMSDLPVASLPLAVPFRRNSRFDWVECNLHLFTQFLSMRHHSEPDDSQAVPQSS